METHSKEADRNTGQPAVSRSRYADFKSVALKSIPPLGAAFLGLGLFVAMSGLGGLPKAAAQEACDLDGVSVSYDFAYSQGPPAGYFITGVVVSGIADACEGAELSVAVEDSSSELARAGPVEADATRTLLLFKTPPLASRVTAVRVEIDQLSVVAVPTLDSAGNGFSVTATSGPTSIPVTASPVPELVVTPGPEPELVQVAQGPGSSAITPRSDVQGAAQTASSTPSPTAAPAPGLPTPFASRPSDRPGIVQRIPGLDDLEITLESLLTNFGLSSLLLALVLIDTSIFNSILKENSDQIHGFLRRRLTPFAGLIRRSDWLFGTTHGQELAIRPLLVLGLSGFVYSLLDPDFGLNTASLVLFLSLVLGLAGATYVYDGGQVLVAEKRFRIPFMIQFFPAAIVIALASVAISRIGGIVPGIVFGFVGSAKEASGLRPTEKQEGAISFLAMSALLTVSVLAWLAVSPVRTLDAGLWGTILEAALVMLFLGSIQGLMFSLIPVTFMEGLRVWKWSKLAWLSLALPVTFLFFLVVLNNGGTLSSATSSRGITVLYIVAIGAWVLTVAAWLFFRRVGRNEASGVSEEDLATSNRP